MARNVERILVIKLSALGDFVLALAAMKQIRKAHPKAHITLLTTPPFEALGKICPILQRRRHRRAARDLPAVDGAAQPDQGGRLRAGL